MGFVDILKQAAAAGLALHHSFIVSAATLQGGRMISALPSETVTVSVPERYFASYDANGKGTYILEAGNYYLALIRESVNERYRILDNLIHNCIHID